MRVSKTAAPGPAVPAPGCGWYLSAPALASAGVYGGTVWTVRSWASCPLGNDASNDIGLTLLMPVVWLCMTLLLLLLPLALRGWLPGGRGRRAAKWLAPLMMVIALTLLYRLGMGWPVHPPGGLCVEGYPLFPFTGKTGPDLAGRRRVNAAAGWCGPGGRTLVA